MQTESSNFNQRYFNIDSNLNSTDVVVVLDALNDLSELLKSLNDKSLVNSALLRLVNLMSLVSNFYVKNKIGLVLAASSKLCIDAMNKSEIVNSLTNQLNASDRLTRLIYLRLIAELAPLFRGEVSTYHHLLTRLAQATQKQELLAVYRCLKSLLVGSRDLSRIYLNNLQSNLCNVQMPQRVLLRLCCFLNLENRDYSRLVEAMWRVVKKSERIDMHQCLAVVLGNAIWCNPIVAELYYRDIRLEIRVEETKKVELLRMVVKNHPYLRELDQETVRLQQKQAEDIRRLLQADAVSLQQQAVDQLLDYLYEMKQSGRQQQNSVTEHLRQFVNGKLHQLSSINDTVLETTLLCCYYLPDNFDDKLIDRVSNSTSIRLLKILAVLRYTKSAAAIVEAILNSERHFSDYLRFILYRSILRAYESTDEGTLAQMCEYSQHKSEQWLPCMLSNYLQKYCMAVTQPWLQKTASAVLQQLNQHLVKLTNSYPSTKDQFECFMGLLQRAITEQLCEVTHNVAWYKQQALKYLPVHALTQATTVRDVLLLGVHFCKASLP